MAFRDDLVSEVNKIFKSRWTERNGYVVPDSRDITIDNTAVILEATVLYADMAESTKLVDTKRSTFAAEVYKTFLYCAAKIVNAEAGEITAYDGDRIMAVFIGDNKDARAARAGLKINNARIEIINPGIKAQYPESSYTLQHVVGVDTGKLYVARTGVRGANDLVWVGKAANHAAKLCNLSSDYPTRITKEVYDNLPNSVKYSSDGKPMWEERNWTDMNRTIYRSSWHWTV